MIIDPWIYESMFSKFRKMDSATKSQPPDCGIASVSSPEYVCWRYQPTNPQDLMQNDQKCIKNSILDRNSYKIILNHIIPIIQLQSVEIFLFSYICLQVVLECVFADSVDLSPLARGVKSIAFAVERPSSSTDCNW